MIYLNEKLNDEGQRFALLKPSLKDLASNELKLRIKILELKSWIGLGVAHFNIIVNKFNYKFFHR